ncbi:MAG: hypothetical protein KC613_15515 [Myxococcales bacterium]|nr:hypothetical protein [Myxococcales bacterium]MCB9523110.1 hypothetical protein [Myxococcales bacterium]
MALPEDRLIDPRKFPEKAQKFADPAAPEPVRMMAARGMVPLKPVVQICVLHNLAHDPSEAVRREAVNTARGMPGRTVVGLAKERMLATVLDWMADVFQDNREVLQGILLNAQTDTDTLVRLAAGATEEQCEILAANQVRLMASPALVKALYFNRNLRASTADRMIDFCVRQEVDLTSLPGHEQIIAAIKQTQVAASAADAQAQDRAFQQVQAALEGMSETEAEQLHEAMSDEEQARRAEEAARRAEEEAAMEKMSAAGKIRLMNIAQKVRLANLGSATERGILINDSNKVVARAVIRSAAITDQEVRNYSKNKALLDEVISYIAKQKRWIRHYDIKVNLVNNPKTPLVEALRFLPYLRINDLRNVARSKGIPPAVAKAAKQMIKARLK